MKKFSVLFAIALVTVLFVVSGMLVGCVPTGSDKIVEKLDKAGFHTVAEENVKSTDRMQLAGLGFSSDKYFAFYAVDPERTEPAVAVFTSDDSQISTLDQDFSYLVCVVDETLIGFLKDVNLPADNSVVIGATYEKDEEGYETSLVKDFVVVVICNDSEESNGKTIAADFYTEVAKAIKDNYAPEEGSDDAPSNADAGDETDSSVLAVSVRRSGNVVYFGTQAGLRAANK